MANQNISNSIAVMKFKAYQAPSFVERKGKDYVLYGEKNDYPDYLIQLFQKSSKHSAIVHGKVDYIIGEGWQVHNNLLNEKTKKSIQQYVDNANEDESLMVVAEKCALDIEIFGGCAIQVTKSKGGSMALNHIAFHHLRTNVDEDKFYYTKKWSSLNPEKNGDYQVLPAYDGSWKQSTSVFYFKQYSPKTSESPVYPLPEYLGSIPYIEIDYEIANFHLNNIKNSFWGSFLINFYNGIPSEEEQLAIEKKIAKKFSGTDNAGRFIANYADGKDRGADMIALTPNDMDKLFSQLNQQVQQEIFTGHKVTSPMLFGIRTEGQLGGRSEIVEAYEIFKKQYIQGKQRQLEDIFNYLYCGNRHERNITLIEKKPIEVELPISEAGAEAVLTPTEIRQILKDRFNLNINPAIPQGQLPGADILPKPSPKPPVGSFNDQDAVKKKEHRLLEKLSMLGEPASRYEVLKSRPIRFCEDEPLNEVQFAIEANPISGTIGNNGASGSTITKIGVKYRYAKDPSAPGDLIIPTTRNFCRDLIAMDKLFSRDEIEKLSAEEGYSVFLYRGGWYHNPDTGRTTPYCRHLWEQVVVKERNQPAANIPTKDIVNQANRGDLSNVAGVHKQAVEQWIAGSSNIRKLANSTSPDDQEKYNLFSEGVTFGQTKYKTLYRGLSFDDKRTFEDVKYGFIDRKGKALPPPDKFTILQSATTDRSVANSFATSQHYSILIELKSAGKGRIKGMDLQAYGDKQYGGTEKEVVFGDHHQYIVSDVKEDKYGKIFVTLTQH